MVGLLSWIFFLVVYTILKPLSFIYTVVIKDRGAKGYWYKSALGLDRYLNYDCYGLLNFMFITKTEAYPFGNFQDTVSYVLGVNQNHKTLSDLGWIATYMLWVIVPIFEKQRFTTKWLKVGHCQWAVATKTNS